MAVRDTKVYVVDTFVRRKGEKKFHKDEEEDIYFMTLLYRNRDIARENALDMALMKTDDDGDFTYHAERLSREVSVSSDGFTTEAVRATDYNGDEWEFVVAEQNCEGDMGIREYRWQDFWSATKEERQKYNNED